MALRYARLALWKPEKEGGLPMTQMLRRALCAAVIAAGCGGDGGEDGSGTPQTCGNGQCDTDESCGNCADCACPAGQTCSGSTCVTDTTPRCGDGRCESGALPDGSIRTDLREDCASCPADCGCDAATQVCSEEHVSCISNNPLIESIPGRWILTDPDTDYVTTVTVDPTQPTCGCSNQTSGDACVGGFDPPNFAVLSGTRLFLDGCGHTLEGQVLEGGTRVEYDRSDTDGNSGHFEWQKQ